MVHSNTSAKSVASMMLKTAIRAESPDRFGCGNSSPTSRRIRSPTGRVRSPVGRQSPTGRMKSPVGRQSPTGRVASPVRLASPVRFPTANVASPGRRNSLSLLESSGLQRLREEQQQRLSEAAVLRRLKTARADLHQARTYSRKTLETTSKALEDHFRKIPREKLHQHIKQRFEIFDRDGSGELDWDEVRAGMAEMGQRPTDVEMEEFFEVFDSDKDGLINLGEFSRMICIKLGLERLDDLREQLAEHAANLRLQSDAESMLEAQRVASMPVDARRARSSRRSSAPDIHG